MNFQNYVIKQIIKYMEYRDEEVESLKREIQSLKEDLENANIVKCSWCGVNREYDRTCDFCDKMSCQSCDDIQHYKSWNLSGCNACNDCVNLWCTLCRLDLKECECDYKFGKNNVNEI